MLEIKRFTRENIGIFISWIPDARFLLQVAGPTLKMDSLEADLEDCVTRSEKPQPEIFLYMASVNSDGKNETVGGFHIMNYNPLHRTATIGRIIIAEQHRGKGYGSLLVEEGLRIAFDELGLHRLHLNVFDFNRTAASCYEKAGFLREGLLRDAVSYRGTYWNTIPMSMLEDEYRKKYKEQS